MPPFFSNALRRSFSFSAVTPLSLFNLALAFSKSVLAEFLSFSLAVTSLVFSSNVALASFKALFASVTASCAEFLFVFAVSTFDVAVLICSSDGFSAFAASTSAVFVSTVALAFSDATLASASACFAFSITAGWFFAASSAALASASALAFMSATA